MLMESTTPRILIVDDTQKNIQVLGTILKREKYQINVAQNGLQAIQMAEKVLPDLILLDVLMPELDGFQACKKLKESAITCDIPVIFLTAKVETEDVIKGFEVGGADYVTKPFNASILLARVRTHIALREKTKQLELFANYDGLTQVANRRYFNEFLDREWRRCIRSQQCLSLIMLDIDYFKIYNDTYGHLQGDEALKKVSAVIKEIGKRGSDLSARYGGEEFIIVLGNTPAYAAQQLAEKLCVDIHALHIPHSGSKINEYITVSLGVASIIPTIEIENSELIKLADKQLYSAKEAGRNQVQFIDLTASSSV